MRTRVRTPFMRAITRAEEMRACGRSCVRVRACVPACLPNSLPLAWSLPPSSEGRHRLPACTAGTPASLTLWIGDGDRHGDRHTGGRRTFAARGTRRSAAEAPSMPVHLLSLLAGPSRASPPWRRGFKVAGRYGGRRVYSPSRPLSRGRYQGQPPGLSSPSRDGHDGPRVSPEDGIIQRGRSNLRRSKETSPSPAPYLAQRASS